MGITNRFFRRIQFGHPNGQFRRATACLRKMRKCSSINKQRFPKGDSQPSHRFATADRRRRSLSLSLAHHTQCHATTANPANANRRSSRFASCLHYCTMPYGTIIPHFTVVVRHPRDQPKCNRTRNRQTDGSTTTKHEVINSSLSMGSYPMEPAPWNPSTPFPALAIAPLAT